MVDPNITSLTKIRVVKITAFNKRTGMEHDIGSMHNISNNICLQQTTGFSLTNRTNVANN